MASIIVASAFVWFLFMSPPQSAPPVAAKASMTSSTSTISAKKTPSSTPVPLKSPVKTVVSKNQSYRPSRQKLDYEAARGTKKKIVSYIKKSNPNISSREVNEIAFWIDEYAKEEGLDPMLVAALISRESSFNKQAVSSTGAKGLGQIKDFNFKSLQIKDPYNVKENVRGTVKYLKHLFTIWKDSNDSTRMALASYYQGPNETKRKKNDFPDHVSNYVNDILSKYRTLNSK